MAAFPWADLLQRLAVFVDGFGHCFGPRARKDAAQLYVAGLLSDADRKNMEGMLDRLGAASRYESVQHFITHSTWKSETVWSELRTRALDDRGVVVVDDTGIPKQGKHSVGVARQYSGTLGKVGNCQIIVTSVLRSARSTWPMAMELYLSEDWAQDGARRASVGVPEDLVFRTKWQIALDQLRSIQRRGTIVDCVLADAAYGDVTEFRRGVGDLGLTYVVGIKSTTTVSLAPNWPSRSDFAQEKPEQIRVMDYLLPDDAWQTVTWRKTANGPLRAQFARIRVVVGQELKQDGAKARSCWLLMERPLNEIAGDKKYYLSNLPEDVPLRRLVDLAHQRWVVEHNYQQLKSELALEHFEGRSFAGLHRHLVLTAMAFYFLERERRRRRSHDLPTLNVLRTLLTDVLTALLFATDERLSKMVRYFMRHPPKGWTRPPP